MSAPVIAYAAKHVEGHLRVRLCVILAVQFAVSEPDIESRLRSTVLDVSTAHAEAETPRNHSIRRRAPCRNCAETVTSRSPKDGSRKLPALHAWFGKAEAEDAIDAVEVRGVAVGDDTEGCHAVKVSQLQSQVSQREC
eukprot:1435558-Rhodomonas_salina.1